MKKKLSIKVLKTKSFITSINREQAINVLGGGLESDIDDAPPSPEPSGNAKKKGG